MKCLQFYVFLCLTLVSQTQHNAAPKSVFCLTAFYFFFSLYSVLHLLRIKAILLLLLAVTISILLRIAVHTVTSAFRARYEYEAAVKFYYINVGNLKYSCTEPMTGICTLQIRYSSVSSTLRNRGYKTAPPPVKKRAWKKLLNHQ